MSETVTVYCSHTGCSEVLEDINKDIFLNWLTKYNYPYNEKNNCYFIEEDISDEHFSELFDNIYPLSAKQLKRLNKTIKFYESTKRFVIESNLTGLSILYFNLETDFWGPSIKDATKFRRKKYAKLFLKHLNKKGSHYTIKEIDLDELENV